MGKKDRRAKIQEKARKNAAAATEQKEIPKIKGCHVIDASPSASTPLSQSTMRVCIGENRHFVVYEDTVVKSDGVVTRAGQPATKKKRRISVVARKLWHGCILLATENGSIRVVRVEEARSDGESPSEISDGQCVEPYCTVRCREPSVIVSTENTVFVGTQRGEIHCLNEEMELMGIIGTSGGSIARLKVSKSDANVLRVRFGSGETMQIDWTGSIESAESFVKSEEIVQKFDYPGFGMKDEPALDGEDEMEEAEEEVKLPVNKQRIRESTAGASWKRSETVMQCLVAGCDYHTWVAQTFITHLRMVHRTTPALAGLVLRCACGDDVFSHHHSRLCPISNFIVVRKDYFGPPRTLVDKMTPKCTLCDVYPNTPYGYADHLHKHHNSSLFKIDCYVKCGSCGVDCRSRNEASTHAKTCKSRFYSLLKVGTASEVVNTKEEVGGEAPIAIEGVKRMTPQCLLCTSYPKTAGGYIQHLNLTHHKTLVQIGWYLKCGACHTVVSSKHESEGHSKKCKTRNFEILQRV